MCTADLFLGLLAVLFPPLPVWVKCGLCSADSIINILLCMLGYIPGLLHSWYIIAKFPEPPYEYDAVPPPDAEGGRVTYVFVGGAPGRQQQPKPQPQGGSNMNYGTASAPQEAQAGSSNAQPQERHEPAPPTYAEAVSGDHKIQTRE